jgi:uncharacterized protein YukJ
MPLREYGLLKGTAIRGVRGSGSDPHFQIHVVDDENDWRIAVNVQSKEHPSAVEFLVDDDFDHPMLDELQPLTSGFRR